jgi:hypothetical protein
LESLWELSQPSQPLNELILSSTSSKVALSCSEVGSAHYVVIELEEETRSCNSAFPYKGRDYTKFSYLMTLRLGIGLAHSGIILLCPGITL